jgi:serine/threonine protein kinase
VAYDSAEGPVYPSIGLAPGSVVAGYRLEERIGAGGMAEVFRARDQRLGRQVALKVLAPALAMDEEFRVRFIREWRAATAVEHPHIIPVYAADESGGVLFIAMRLVTGGDMRSVIRRDGPLAPERTAALVSAIASALDAAHAGGLVHRDVKPGNMLIDAVEGLPEHVYLSDFGLSKGTLSSIGLTGKGQFLGTPHYSAPEQVSGAPLDGRADQYALACVAVEMLTGHPPYPRDDPMAVLYAHTSVPPPSVTSARPDLVPAVDVVIARAMAKTASERYLTCSQFASQLRDALITESLPRRVPTVSPPSQPAAAPVPAPSPVTEASSVSTQSVALSGPPALAEQPASSVPYGPPPPGATRLARDSRWRGRRVVVIGSAAALLAAAAIVTPFLLMPATAHSNRTPPSASPSQTPVGGKGHTPAPAGPVATLTDPVSQGVQAVTFVPGGALRTIDANGHVYTFASMASSTPTSLPLARDLVPGTPAFFSLDGTKVLENIGGVCTIGGTTCGTAIVDIVTGRTVVNLPSSGYAPVGSGTSVAALLIPADDGVGLTSLSSGGPIDNFVNPDAHYVTGEAVSPDGKILTTASDGTDKVYVFDTKTGDVTATLHYGSTAGTVEIGFSGDGTTLAVNDTYGKDHTYFWDTGTWQRFAEVPAPFAALSPDGKIMASISSGSVKLWDVSTGKVIGTRANPKAARASSVVFSPDGKMLAVGAQDGIVYVWKTPS